MYKISLLIFVFLLSNNTFSQTSKIGAYYFDGWTGAYPYHITESLRRDFSEREPKWGWITSKQSIMDEQVQMAHDSGLSFFNFCWYYKSNTEPDTEPLNHALTYFLSSKCNNMKFCLTVVNHKGWEVGPENWFAMSKRLVRFLADDKALRVEDKPLLVFYSLASLIEAFGSEREVFAALNNLRKEAKIIGLNKIQIAVCVSPDPVMIKKAEKCGFDILTGYNYHEYALFRKSSPQSITVMQQTEVKLWNSFATLSSLKYFPVSTLNWDPRPWATNNNSYSTDPYFFGYNEKSVYTSIRNCIQWIDKQSASNDEEYIGLLYAWNEYGEGAWLTPSFKDKLKLLRGVKAALLVH